MTTADRSIWGFDKRLFLLSWLVVATVLCLHGFPSDDGLRHVGKAFSDVESWGETYPFSRFEEFGDYNPWFGYDRCLRIIAGVLSRLPLSGDAAKFLIVKGLSFLFLVSFLYLVFSRSQVPSAITNREEFTLAYILAALLLALPIQRIMIIRPFAFGSFFIFYSLGQKGFVRGALSSAILIFFYPYLFWIYTFPVVTAHWLKGDRNFAWGVLAATILFLSFQPPSFWGFQFVLFESRPVRDAVDFQTGELRSAFGGMDFYLLAAAFITAFPFLSKQSKVLNTTHLLTIFFLPLAILHCRYFIDLTLPLVFIAFGKDALEMLVGPYRKILSYWESVLKSGFQKAALMAGKRSGELGTTGGVSKHEGRSGIIWYITALYLLLTGMMVYGNFEKLSDLKEFRKGLSEIPAGARILTDFNLQYKALYARPDLSVIPSCELGSPTEGIAGAYIDFFNKGLLLPLARKTGADYLLEGGKKYINPIEGKHLSLVWAGEDVSLWCIHRK